MVLQRYSCFSVFAILFSAVEVSAMVDFKPKIINVKITPAEVRPGDFLTYTVEFINEGTECAEKDYRIFVHFEYPEKSCRDIVFQDDHEPTIPTTDWLPGKVIVDGPRTIQVPPNVPEGVYNVHVGVYQWEPEHIRFCEDYPAYVTVNKTAAPSLKRVPKLSHMTIKAREKNLKKRLKKPVSIESDFVKFSITEGGTYEILDKQSNVTWCSNPFEEGFGVASVHISGKRRLVFLNNFMVNKTDTELKLIDKSCYLEITVKLLNEKTIEISYSAPKDTEIEHVRLLNEALWITDTDRGYIVLPTGMGMLIPSDSGVFFSRQFKTFQHEGCDMEMIGLVKQGSAVLISWHDPYIVPEIKSQFVDLPIVPGRQIISTTMILKKTAKALKLTFLGRGDVVTIAKAYRTEAERKGYVVTLADKIKKNNEIEKLLGAANVRLWCCFIRHMAVDSKTEKSHTLNWTFDEAAQIAEHIKNDLKLDKVLFILGGWIHRGYDNQHPDILPAAPECGGNDALLDCSNRVKKLGYLFCLHDNYQDMYRDAPSWDEKYLMRDAYGNLMKGGIWAGGQAYLICSKKALELAKRPDKNLPAVKRLFNPNAYFIDTTFAAPLMECYAPQHPLTKQDDMRYKQELANYARSLFGIFGSEDGKEWAIPYGEFFEGIGGVSGRYYMTEGLLGSLGAIEIPLFSMVYHDCIVPYGKYGYDPWKAGKYVLYHLIGAYPLNYHIIRPRLYWKRDVILQVKPAIDKIVQESENKFSISYIWQVNDKVREDWTVFVHFIDSAGEIKFQNDHDPSPKTSSWEKGAVKQGPFIVKVPEGYSGVFPIVMGLYNTRTGERAVLLGEDDGFRRYKVGFLEVKDQRITFKPLEPSEKISPQIDYSVFCRADNGWAEGFCMEDIFMKNTYEILSPLHELTAHTNITEFRFLSSDYKVMQSVFGAQEVQVTINSSERNYEHKCKDGSVVNLPPLGFVIESPTFVAFHALSFNELKYDKSSLFTIRSLDNKPIIESKKIRIFHVFGDTRIRIRNIIETVYREKIVDFQ